MLNVSALSREGHSLRRLKQEIAKYEDVFRELSPQEDG
jgi:hypothetical protein